MLTKVLKVSFLSGSIASVFMAIYFAVLFFSGVNIFDFAYNLDFWIPLIFLIIAVKLFRDRYNGGVLHFWQGISITFITGTVIGSVLFIFIYLFLGQIYQEEYQEQVNNALRVMNENKAQMTKSLGEDGFEYRRNQLKKLTPLSMGGAKFAWEWILSLIYGLIVTVFFRRK